MNVTPNYAVVLETGERHNLNDMTFGESCFEAMMLSDGKPCTLFEVASGLNSYDVKAWNICEGDNPDYDAPDWQP